MRLRASIAFSLSWLVLFAFRPAAAETRFDALGFLPVKDGESRATGVSGDGSVVIGASRVRRGSRAVLWTEKGGRFHLEVLPGRKTDAYAASTDGKVIVGDVGRKSRRLFPAPFPFGGTKFDAVRWIRGEPVAMPRTKDGSYAADVSGDGSVVCGTSSSSAVIWIGGERRIRLGGLARGDGTSRASGISADGRVVVGTAGGANGEAFRWTAETGVVGLGVLPGGVRSEANAVSADGSTVVGYSLSSGVSWQAFRWTEGEGITGLGDFPGGLEGSVATAVSGDGARVVGQGNSRYYVEPFLWDAAHGMRLLADVLTDNGLDMTNWRLESADGISDDGTVIVGTGIVLENGMPLRRAWRAVIPAP